jgi:hypothetical protein
MCASESEHPAVMTATGILATNGDLESSRA